MQSGPRITDKGWQLLWAATSLVVATGYGMEEASGKMPMACADYGSMACAMAAHLWIGAFAFASALAMLGLGINGARWWSSWLRFGAWIALAGMTAVLCWSAWIDGADGKIRWVPMILIPAYCKLAYDALGDARLAWIYWGRE